MILVGVSPTEDVAVVSLSQVQNKIRLKWRQTLYEFVKKSMSYVAFIEESQSKKDFETNKFGSYNSGDFAERSSHVMMPLDTAWRLINDFKAGKILQNVERL